MTKIDVIKQMQKGISKGIHIDGALIVFTDKDGNAGGHIISSDRGVTLRVLHEAKIQEKYLELEIELQAKSDISDIHSDKFVKNKSNNYIG